jgi:NAD(P)-dependent dehydrogenase (short-subunit alcohol dehydrogenase family)
MTDALGLSGQRIVVVGAASGIGAAVARLAATEGAEVVTVDREPIPVPLGGQAITLDIADRPSVEAALAALGQIDALVVTAAYCSFDDWLDPDWDAAFDRTMEVNLRGPINLVRAALTHLPDGSGRIVLLGSVAGRWAGLSQGRITSPRRAVCMRWCAGSRASRRREASA